MLKEGLRTWYVVLAAIIAIQLIPGPAVAQESRAVTVFIAKKIVTMDPGWPLATAVGYYRWGPSTT